MSAGSELSIEECLREYWPHSLRPGSLPEWPPDLFALAAILLHRSGAYVETVEQWRPRRALKARGADSKAWPEHARSVGHRWHDEKAPPTEVQRAWAALCKAHSEPVAKLRRSSVLAPLVELVAFSDEASAGFGMPTEGASEWQWRAFKNIILREPPTLCENIRPGPVRVLPKQHTPQVGITLRSLSHHLALCFCGDVDPRWFAFGNPQVGESEKLNLLLVPWPKQIDPSDFDVSPKPRNALPKPFGFFRFAPRHHMRDVPAALERLVRRAAHRLGARIDGVILPELAVTRSMYGRARRRLLRHGTFLLAGIAEPRENCLTFTLPLHPSFFFEITQHKHHRWRLERNQIQTYALQNQLDRNLLWWEDIKLPRRGLSFICLRSWLTLCPLICEDLARQDPIAELVRAVGPNLVLALLLDGPQLERRWPGRYASILAEDPGSAVLTLTSIGMSQLSTPPSRTIALWKDPITGTRELELPNGADALAITLVRERALEWSADGRHDGDAVGLATSGIPVLVGQTGVSL